jgi:hypothetical protein
VRGRPAALLANGPTLNPAEILGCRTKGATVGYSAEATEAARERVRSELELILKR